MLCFEFRYMMKSINLPGSELSACVIFIYNPLIYALNEVDLPTRKLQRPKPASVCELTSDG